MATWESDKFQEDEDADSIGDNFDNILVTHDLQDCLDDTLDLSSFEKVYEQRAVFDYERYSDDDAAINERPIPADDNTTGWVFPILKILSTISISRFPFSVYFARTNVTLAIRSASLKSGIVDISFAWSSVYFSSPPYKAITSIETRALIHKLSEKNWHLNDTRMCVDIYIIDVFRCICFWKFSLFYFYITKFQNKAMCHMYII